VAIDLLILRVIIKNVKLSTQPQVGCVLELII